MYGVKCGLFNLVADAIALDVSVHGLFLESAPKSYLRMPELFVETSCR
jgi:hypothetical protein